MIFLAASVLASPLVAGDEWSWDVELRYDDPAEGRLLTDRERWTVRVGPKKALTVERLYLGSMVNDDFVPGPKGEPEKLKGTIDADGTLTVSGDWSDAASTRILKRLLVAKEPKERLAGWPVVARSVVRESNAVLPGNDQRADLTVDVRLTSARLGGRKIEIPKPSTS